MIGRMALFTAEASHGSRARDAVDALRRAPRWALPYAAGASLAFGLFVQIRTGSVLVSCQRDAGELPSCRLDRRALFGAMSIGSERVTGVQRARAITRQGYRGRPESATFVVVLDTAEGQRVAGWSIEGEPAYVLTNTINGRLEAGVARFEATMRPHLIDGIVRLFGNFCIILSVGLAMLSVLRWLWPAPAPGAVL